METSNSSRIYSIVSNYVGIEVSKVLRVTHNNFLFLDFGNLKENERGHIVGENRLSLLNAWRLENADSILAASRDTNSEVLSRINVLVGLSLRRIVISEPALDSIFEFSGGIRVAVFNLISEGEDIDREAWRFYYSDKILSIGPGTKVNIAQKRS